MNYRNLLIVILATSALQVSAQTAYRSVDEEGNVTFSDQPVAGAAEESEILIDAPAPSTESRQESRKQATEMMDAARSGQQTSSDAGLSKAQRQQEAKEALERAESNLREAEVVKAGDRKGTASGGSRLTPGYLERVQEAEQAVEQARQQVKTTR